MKSSFVAFLLLGAAYCRVPTCNDGWTSFDGAIKCYKLVEYPTHYNAQGLFNLCSDINGTAVSVHNAFENKFVFGLSGYYVFIGTTFSMADYFQNVDGSPVNYVPNLDYFTGKEDCVMGIEESMNWYCRGDDDGFANPIVCQQTPDE